MHEHLLRQRIFCRECGSKYHTDTQLAEHKKAGPIPHYYCRHPTRGNTCEFRHAFRRNELEGLAKDWIVEWVDNPEVDWDLLMGRTSPDNALLAKD
ncbi:MAG: recombinase zinc beta ribbon domain-containing protein [Chloroflexi bacterium]|nr:recombinase zinc beta ribbon domain-containing protein [Chloroflexota bacterium]